jgi:hypothetical protein
MIACLCVCCLRVGVVRSANSVFYGLVAGEVLSTKNRVSQTAARLRG